MYKHPTLQMIDLIKDRLAELKESENSKATGNQIEKRLKNIRKQNKLIHLLIDVRNFYNGRF